MEARTEGKFLKRAVRRFGEEEPYEYDFKEKENAVADIILPA